LLNGNNLWKLENFDELENLDFFKNDNSVFKSEANSLYELFYQSVVYCPNNTAIMDEIGESYTYDELDIMVTDFSKYLIQEENVNIGDRVAVMLFNSVEFIVSVLALSKIAAVLVLLPTKFKEKEITSLVEKLDNSLLIVDNQFKNQVSILEDKEILNVNTNDKNGLRYYKASNKNVTFPKTSKEMPATIMFTSGTTSDSKACLIKNYNIVHAILSYKNILNINVSDIALIGTPMYHISGLVGVLGLFLSVGGKIIFHKKFNTQKILETIQKEKVTFIHASPTVFLMLLEQKEKLRAANSLRLFICGSSNMPVEKILEIKECLPNLEFRTVYGLTETTSPATIFPTDVASSKFRGSSGLPIPGIELKIINMKGQDIGKNTAGEILVRGSTVIDEYVNRNIGDIDQEGWLSTGDIGYINEEGHLFVVDRIKDMINHGGEKIWTIDIENEIYKIAGVEEVAVVPVSDETYGENVGAYVRIDTQTKLNSEEVKEKLKGKIASFKVPEQLKEVSYIPKTDNGKINKNLIRKNLEEEKLSVK